MTSAAAAQMNVHPHKRGDRVTVFSRNGRGEYIIEGEATIVRPIKALDYTYMVAFSDGQYQRFVDPDGQADPQAFLAKLTQSPS